MIIGIFFWPKSKTKTDIQQVRDREKDEAGATHIELEQRGTSV